MDTDREERPLAPSGAGATADGQVLRRRHRRRKRLPVRADAVATARWRVASSRRHAVITALLCSAALLVIAAGIYLTLGGGGG